MALSRVSLGEAARAKWSRRTLVLEEVAHAGAPCEDELGHVLDDLGCLCRADRVVGGSGRDEEAGERGQGQRRERAQARGERDAHLLRGLIVVYHFARRTLPCREIKRRNDTPARGAGGAWSPTGQPRRQARARARFRACHCRVPAGQTTLLAAREREREGVWPEVAPRVRVGGEGGARARGETPTTGSLDVLTGVPGQRVICSSSEILYKITVTQEGEEEEAVATAAGCLCAWARARRGGGKCGVGRDARARPRPRSLASSLPRSSLALALQKCLAQSHTLCSRLTNLRTLSSRPPAMVASDRSPASLARSRSVSSDTSFHTSRLSNQGGQLIVVANRLPVSVTADPKAEGGYRFSVSSGGLASALSGCKKKMDFVVSPFFPLVA